MAVVQQTDFDTLEAALARVDAQADASDSHGLLCGLICAAGVARPEQWRAALLGEADGAAGAADVVALLSGLSEDARVRIQGEDMDFELLLPDDDAPLADRAECLGQWCQGFLSGLGLGGVPEDARLPEDAAELIRDFTEISRVEFDLTDAGEEDEVAFAEIVEFVRVGVLLLSEELRPGHAPAAANPDKLH